MNLLRTLFGETTGTSAIDAAEARDRLNQKGKEAPLVLDVRQPDEFRGGHIKGAKLIPLNELPKRLSELPQDREIICVCRSGARSGTATRQLISAGYQAVNLRGGMSAWQHAGYPTQKGK